MTPVDRLRRAFPDAVDASERGGALRLALPLKANGYADRVRLAWAGYLFAFDGISRRDGRFVAEYVVEERE